MTLRHFAGHRLVAQGLGERLFRRPGLREECAVLEKEAMKELLLPGFDELVLGYRDRLHLMDEARHDAITPGGNGVFRRTALRPAGVPRLPPAARGGLRPMDRPSYGYSAADAPPPQGPVGGGPQEQPVCPRHPDRVSYVRCKRCDRPACPDCQRPTNVGVLCVDCERELARAQASTRPRTAMGGRMRSGAPVVTYTLIALCVLAYLGQMVAPQIVEQLGIFAPFRALAMPWTFLTAGFLHGGIMHLALNMYALWAMGQFLERSLGPARFAAIYFVSMLGGHTAVYVLADPMGYSWLTGTVGASGGVFGLFAAAFIVNRRMGGQVAQIGVLIALNLVITFTVPNISWQGHLGGLLLGAALTAGMYALRPKAVAGQDRQALARRSAITHGALVVAAVVLCAVLVAVKTMLLPGL